MHTECSPPAQGSTHTSTSGACGHVIGGLVSNMRLRSGCRKHWLMDENATPLISEFMRSAHMCL